MTHRKIYGTIQALLAGHSLDTIPLGFNIDLMCKTIKSAPISKKQLISAVQSIRNHQIIPSYISPGIYKSTMSFGGIYDIIKIWKKKEMSPQMYFGNVNEEFRKKILLKETTCEPNFDHVSQKTKKVPRFMPIGKGMGPKGRPLSRLVV